MTDKPQPLKEGKDTSEGKIARSTGWVAIVMMVVGAITTYLPSLQERLAEDTQTYVVVGGIIAVAGLVGRVLVTLGYAKARTNLKLPLIDVIKEQEVNRGKALQAETAKAIHAGRRPRAESGMQESARE